MHHHPTVILAILDDENAPDHLGVRGLPAEVISCPTGELYVHLGVRYGDSAEHVPTDGADRVILVVNSRPCRGCCARTPGYCLSVVANLTRSLRVRDSKDPTRQ